MSRASQWHVDAPLIVYTPMGHHHAYAGYHSGFPCSGPDGGLHDMPSEPHIGVTLLLRTSTGGRGCRAGSVEAYDRLRRDDPLEDHQARRGAPPLAWSWERLISEAEGWRD